MTNEEIAVELARQGQHLKSQGHRIDELEEQQKETRALVRSVDKLAQSVESTILTAVATGLIGYALACIIAK